VNGTEEMCKKRVTTPANLKLKSYVLMCSSITHESQRAHGGSKERNMRAQLLV
jgi:hypothetical protein